MVAATPIGGQWSGVRPDRCTAGGSTRDCDQIERLVGHGECLNRWRREPFLPLYEWNTKRLARCVVNLTELSTLRL